MLSPFSSIQLCNPMDCSLPGSSVNGILQVIILEWVALPSSRGSSQPRNQIRVSYVSYTGRQVFYREDHLGSLRCASKSSLLISLKKSLSRLGMNISMTLLTPELHSQCFTPLLLSSACLRVLKGSNSGDPK